MAMPKYEDINLQSGAVLTASERAHIRMILGIPEDSTMDLYINSESRFTAMTGNAWINKLFRTLFHAYDAKGDSMVRYESRDGVKYEAALTRTRIAVILDQLVFPKVQQRPLEQIFLAENQNAETSKFQSIPIKYGELDKIVCDDFAVPDTCP